VRTLFPIEHVSLILDVACQYFTSSLLHCLSDGSSLASIEEAEMHDASSLMCVEMLDAAVGVDTIAEPFCHVAVQTCAVTSCRIACQTSITTYNTCAVQTDDVTILHVADNVSHSEGKLGNFKLPENKTTCSTSKKDNVETSLSRKVDIETVIQTRHVTDSSLASVGKVKMLDTSTSTCVEMLDAAVGVDTVTDPPCHVAVQTSDITSYRIAGQTSITTYNTCAVQTDVVTIPHTADNISHPGDRLGNCKLSQEKTTCSIRRNQNVETKLFRKVDTEAGIQTQCLSDYSVLNNDNLKAYVALLKGAEKVRFFSLTSKQNSMESKSKNQSTMIRCDYKKPEKCLREELKKWESLAAWLCSNKSDDSSDEDFPFRSDDSSIPAPTAQSSTDRLLAQQSIPSTDRLLTQQSTPATDNLLTEQIIPASSGLFAVEDTPYSSGDCKKNHPDECLMPVVPHFQHHYMCMDPLLFQPNIMNCELAMPSMAKLLKSCCYKNSVIDACPSMNHHCVSQTAHTHQELRNCCCNSCVNTNHSNHKLCEREKRMRMSSIRLTSDKKSAKQPWKRIVDTEDSSDGSERGDNYKMPSRKMFHKSLRINSTSSTETDSEIENTGSRRRGIYAEKQDSSVCVGSGRRVAVKRLWKRRKVAHNERDCQISVGEERKYRTARSEKINTCLKENYLQAGSFSDNKQQNSACSRLQERKNEHEVHKKDLRKCISKKMLDEKFPLPKLKHRPKHLMCGQLNEHTEDSGTSVMKICSEFQAGSCNTVKPTILQSNVKQKTEAATEEDTQEHLSCIELFGNVSDICSDEEQQSGRTAAEVQTVQPGKVSSSSLNKRKRRAPSSSAGQVESRSIDCASFETQKSKRAKTGFLSKENNDSMTSKDSETISDILLHSVSESDPEKHITRTCRASTGISLSSREQIHSNQEYNISTANESFLMPELLVSTHKTGQAAGKTDASRAAGSLRKLSKLEKLRRNLTRAKMPSKIAAQLPEKIVKCRKALTPRSKTSCVGSESNRPGVKESLLEMAREDETPNSVTSVSNFYRPSHQIIPAVLLENEKPSTKHDTTTHKVVNGFINPNNHDNSMVGHPFTCNSVTGQICSNTYIVKEPDTNKEIHTKTNHAVDVSKSFASTDTILDAEIPDCFQDRIPVSSYVTETVRPISVSEIQTNSNLTDKGPETVKVSALPISYKENISQASQVSETVGLVTLPHAYSEASNKLETVTEVCSQNMSSETCQAGTDCRDIESFATVSKIGELEDIIFPNLCQEPVPCPVSPIKDLVIGEPQLNSKINESSISTQDTIQIAELPGAGLSIESPGRLTGSSMHEQTGKQITVWKSTITKNTDEKLFAGCVLQWVLKDYEVEYKKKHPKKSKSMISQLKDKG
jgi:hypothetical protein